MATYPQFAGYGNMGYDQRGNPQMSNPIFQYQLNPALAGFGLVGNAVNAMSGLGGYIGQNYAMANQMMHESPLNAEKEKSRRFNYLASLLSGGGMGGGGFGGGGLRGFQGDAGSAYLPTQGTQLGRHIPSLGRLMGGF